MGERERRSRAGILRVAVLLGLAVAGSAAADNLYYKELARDGRIYVFNNPDDAARFEKTGELARAITRVGAGPNGETVVADSERALELYFFKHGVAEEVPPPPPPKATDPAWKIHGLVFGDYYWFSQHHDPKWNGQQGFWLRRAYLTYDHRLSSAFSMRLRLEMNSNGDLEGGDLVPYVKDAYLTWAFTGRQLLRLGLQPSLTFDAEEQFWGLRHVEKTPADLYRIDSSRDFGLSVSGPVPLEGLGYAAHFGNDSGNGSETDKYKVIRLLALYDRKPGLHAEAFYSYGRRPEGMDRKTAKGLVGFSGKAFRLGGQYLWQRRESGTTGVPDDEIRIWSAFGVLDPLPEKLTLFARWDDVGARRGDGDFELGVPGVDGLDYLPISDGAPFQAWIFGLEWYLLPQVRIGPNVEWVRYGTAPSGLEIENDVVPRITFYWTW